MGGAIGCTEMFAMVKKTVLTITVKISRVVLLLVCCTTALSAWATPATPAPPAKSLRVAVGNIPPYVIFGEDRGIEFDIFTAAMKLRGYSITPVYSTIRRTHWLLAQKKVDAAISLHSSSSPENIFYSKSHITFKNVAVSLAEKNIRIDAVDDLKQHRIAAFKLAQKVLGKSYAENVAMANMYVEVFDPNKLVPLLYRKRVDVIVIEETIFKYFRQQQKRQGHIDVSADFILHPIFTPSNIRAGFWDPRHRDDFELGLKEIIASGRYQQIYQSYLEQVPSP